MYKVNKVKILCKNITLEQIDVHRKEQIVNIWVNIRDFYDFITELECCLSYDVFDDGGIDAKIVGDSVYIGNFTDYLEMYESNAYKMFINCMQNRMHINYYD